MTCREPSAVPRLKVACRLICAFVFSGGCCHFSFQNTSKQPCSHWLGVWMVWLAWLLGLYDDLSIILTNGFDCTHEHVNVCVCLVQDSFGNQGSFVCLDLGLFC